MSNPPNFHAASFGDEFAEFQPMEMNVNSQTQQPEQYIPQQVTQNQIIQAYEPQPPFVSGTNPTQPQLVPSYDPSAQPYQQQQQQEINPIDPYQPEIIQYQPQQPAEEPAQSVVMAPSEPLLITTSPPASGSLPPPSPSVALGSPPPPSSPAAAVAKPAAKVPVKRAGRKKKDPNAPASVSTAYQFFFKETQASVKTHNPNAKFGEVSKIVASMWEALGEEDRAVYKKRNADDKIRHEQEMNEYRAKQVAEGIDPDAAPGIAANKPETKKLPTRGVAAKKAAAGVVVTAGNHGKVVIAKPAPVSQTSSSESKEEDGTEEAEEEDEITENDCIREGCIKKAVKNIEWEDEYCSNACVVDHCKNVFASWVLEKQQG